MVGRILEHWRILTATLLALVFVAGAFFLARGVDWQQVVQASTETALLQAVATKDSDADGLPDWQEALYGTNPHLSDTKSLGMTDGEAVAKGLVVPKAIADISVASSTAGVLVDPSLPAVPSEGTLADLFAKKFFSLYVVAKDKNGGEELSSDQINALAIQVVNELSTTLVPSPDFKSARDLTITVSSEETFRTFAARVETVMRKNVAAATKSDLEYFLLAAENNNPDARAHLFALAKSYRDTAAGIAALPAPSDLASTDLIIINSLMRLGGIYSDWARVNQDAMAAMLALEQYQKTELELERAFATLPGLYAAKGIVFQNGTPGAAFVNAMANIGAAQAAAKRND